MSLIKRSLRLPQNEKGKLSSFPTKRPSLWLNFFPYFLFALAYLLLPVSHGERLPVSFFLLWMIAGAIIATVIIQQIIALRKKERLNLQQKETQEKLEINFDQRTGQLAQVNEELFAEIFRRQKIEAELQAQHDFTLQIMSEQKQTEEAIRESEQRYRQLFTTAQRQAQELSLLDQVRTALACEMDMPNILHKVVEAIAQTFDYQLVSLYLLQGDQLILQHQVGYENVIYKIPLGEGVISKVIRSGKPVLVEDVRSDQAFLGAIQDIVSEIAVPLCLRGQIIGVLNVESTQGVVLEEADLRLLIALTNSINIAFERAQLYAEVRENEERFHASVETLLDGFAILSAIRNEKSRIVDFLYEYVNEAGCLLCQMTRDELVGKRLLEALPANHVSGLFADYVQVVESGQPFVKETALYENTQDGRRRLKQAFDVRAVKLGDGFASSWQDITERKLAEDRRADWVAQLEEHNREITLLNELGDLFQVCQTKEEAFQIIAKYVERLFPQEVGSLYLINSSQTFLECVAEWGRGGPLAPTFEPDDCWSIRRGRSHLVDCFHSEVACKHVNTRLAGAHLCVPLVAQGETFGVFTLAHVEPGEEAQRSARAAEPVFSEPKQHLATTVAEHITLALANLRLRESLRQQAIRDPLTNLFNRRYMEETLEREIARAERRSSPLGIIMLDIDHFKSFNDTYGHEAGDAVLRELGYFLKIHIRKEDVACRYGGEEFVLILPETSLETACERAETIREEATHLYVKHRGQMLGMITLSLGVAAFPMHGSTAGLVLRTADAALYSAKKEGRNRTVVVKG